MLTKLTINYIKRINKNALFFLKNILSNYAKKIQFRFFDINIKTTWLHLYYIVFFLKKNSLTQCKILTDIFSVDFLGKKYRFLLNYYFLSYFYNIRIYLSIKLTEYFPISISLTSIHKTALWVEREVFDLFGIFFFKNNNLKRILTDYGFIGFPFRKDFPLCGFIELFYDDCKKNICYKNVNLTQNYRNFKLKNCKII